MSNLATQPLNIRKELGIFAFLIDEQPKKIKKKSPITSHIKK